MDLIKKYKVAIFLIIFLVALILLPRIINDLTAKSLLNKLMEVKLPNKTKLIDTAYNAGKVLGNGNGMQYYGAILIESDLKYDNLKAYYSKYQKEKLKFEVVKHSENPYNFYSENLKFKDYNKNKKYYIIYYQGNGIPVFKDLDIRGH